MRVFGLQESHEIDVAAFTNIAPALTALLVHVISLKTAAREKDIKKCCANDLVCRVCVCAASEINYT